MVFHSNVLHCILFTFKRENDEISRTHNHNYYCRGLLSITVPFANVFITDEDLDIDFNGRLSGKRRLNCAN